MKAFVKKRWKILLIILILLGFLLYPPVVLMEIRADFVKDDYSAGNHWKVLTSYRENVGLNSVQRTYERPGTAHTVFFDFSFRKGDYVKRIDPVDYHMDNEILLRDLAFYVNGMYAGKLDGETLYAMLTPNEQVEMSLTEEGDLRLVILGEDSQLATKEEFWQFYSAAARRYAWMGVLYLIPLMAAAVFAAAFYRRYVRRLEGSKLFSVSNTILYAVGVCAIVLIFIGAFVGSSAINPDETEGIYCVNYYTEHWRVPDIRELELKAFSKFGTARLSELNLYYIFAAQIARFITFENGTRMFGVLMGAGLFYLAFLNLKKNRYLLCALFLTPQVWYLYTYCTSDAMDFAVSVLVLYQLANPDSMLQRLMRNGIGRRDIWRVLLLGFLFANVFMSKQNYYVIAVYAFSILLTELVFEKGEQKKLRFQSCLWIAGAALLFLGIRYIPEFLHYGIYKQRIILEVQNKVAIPKLRPSSPPEVQSSAFNLYGKGVPFTEFWLHRGLNTTLFTSFVGTYGCLQFPSPVWYTYLMGFLYVVLYAGMSWNIWKEKGQKERKVKFVLLHLMALISYLLVLFNGYFIDFQAQGRYMLPVLIFVAHGASLNPELVKQKWFQGLICITALLSLYSFACIGIPNIQPV